MGEEEVGTGSAEAGITTTITATTAEVGGEVTVVGGTTGTTAEVGGGTTEGGKKGWDKGGHSCC